MGKIVFEYAVVECINSLRWEVGELRSEVQKLKTTGTALSQNAIKSKLCSVYVQVQCVSGGEGYHIEKSELESLLGCHADFTIYASS